MTDTLRTAPRAAGTSGRLPRTPARRAATGRPAAVRTVTRTGSATARRSRVPFALVVVGSLAGGLTLLLGLNTMSAANELERHSLSEKDTAVAAQVQQLHDEVALAQAPGNLARAAEALGMVPAGNPAFLVLDRAGHVRVLGSAAPATAAPLPVQPPPPKKRRTHKPPTAGTTRTTGTGTTGTTGTAGTTGTRRTTGTTAGTTTGRKPTTADHPTHTPTPKPTVTLGGTR